MNTVHVLNGQIKKQNHMNKIEAIVIVVGIGLAVLGIAIHLIRQANRSRKEAQKPLESISAIKGGESIEYPSSTTIKLKGTLESSKPAEVAMRVAKNSTYGAYGPTGITGPVGSTSKSLEELQKTERDRISKKYKKQEPKFVDVINEDDKKLVRQATQEGDFLTSMLVAQMSDSAILGTIVGGDPVGAIVGDMLNDSDSSKSSSDDHGSSHSSGFDDFRSSHSSYDDSPSYDYGSSSSDSSSWDSGSSFDSSSSDW